MHPSTLTSAGSVRGELGGPALLFERIRHLAATGGGDAAPAFLGIDATAHEQSGRQRRPSPDGAPTVHGDARAGVEPGKPRFDVRPCAATGGTWRLPTGKWWNSSPTAADSSGTRWSSPAITSQV